MRTVDGTAVLTIHVLPSKDTKCKHEELPKARGTYISEDVRSCSLSSGWSSSVNISEHQPSVWDHPGRPKRTFIKRLFGHSARSISAGKVCIHSL